MSASRASLPAGRLLLGAVVLLAAGWAVWQLWPNEERQVRRRLSELRKVINERPADGLSLVARAARLTEFLTEDVAFDPGRQGSVIAGRDRLVALASRSPNPGGAFRIDFVDLAVSVRGNVADAHLTAALSSTDVDDGETQVDAREVDLTLVKGQDWRIQRIVLVEVLEKPPS